jgi:hypothetical protein
MNWWGALRSVAITASGLTAGWSVASQQYLAAGLAGLLGLMIILSPLGRS